MTIRRPPRNDAPPKRLALANVPALSYPPPVAADGVATRKEAERRVEAREALKDIRQTQRRRWRDALADSVRDHGGGDDAGAGDSKGASPAGARD